MYIIYIHIYMYIIIDGCKSFSTTGVIFIVALQVTLYIPFTNLHGMRRKHLCHNCVS